MIVGQRLFQDRQDAGRQLAERLLIHEKMSPVVVALPRGGVPIGFEIAQRLKAPLDILLVRKLRHPEQPELAIGALVDGEKWDIVLNEELFEAAQLPPNFLGREIQKNLKEMNRMNAFYRQYRDPMVLTDRTVLLVDDGIATGATIRSAIKRIRQEEPKKIIVAAPVASLEAVNLIREEADDVICLHIPPHFGAVGDFYENFRPVPNEEVVKLLSICCAY